MLDLESKISDFYFPIPHGGGAASSYLQSIITQVEKIKNVVGGVGGGKTVGPFYKER